MNQIKRWAYAADEIRNNMFLPLIKKALTGGIGGRRQNWPLFSYDKILIPSWFSILAFINFLCLFMFILRNFHVPKFKEMAQIFFSKSKPKNIYFSCQIKCLNIFLVRSFSYRQINLTWKVNLFKPFTWKILFNSLRACKET